MKKNQRGFTLLELLLVVGIAAVLIIAGITLYSQVNRSRKIDETYKLVNIIIDQVHKLYGGKQDYGMEPLLDQALVNTGGIPAKYVQNGAIVLPFSAEPVEVRSAGAAFSIFLRMPPAYIPELTMRFFIDTTRIDGVMVCGTPFLVTNPLPSLDAMAALCGNSTAVPAAFNLIIGGK